MIIWAKQAQAFMILGYGGQRYPFVGEKTKNAKVLAEVRLLVRAISMEHCYYLGCLLNSWFYAEPAHVALMLIHCTTSHSKPLLNNVAM